MSLLPLGQKRHCRFCPRGKNDILLDTFNTNSCAVVLFATAHIQHGISLDCTVFCCGVLHFQCSTVMGSSVVHANLQYCAAQYGNILIFVLNVWNEMSFVPLGQHRQCRFCPRGKNDMSLDAFNKNSCAVMLLATAHPPRDSTALRCLLQRCIALPVQHNDGSVSAACKS